MNFVLRFLARTRPRDLIGPPDPISNIRPVIVNGHRHRAGGENHPYSLNEFSSRDEDADLQWRIQRDSLNAFNHAFWSDSNSRFMREKQQAVAHLPMDAMREKELALSTFYSQWSAQESALQAAYTEEWNARNRAVIILSVRRQLRIWKDTLRDTFTKR